MTSILKSVLLFVAVCVFAIFGARLLIVGARGVALAQPPEYDRGGGTGNSVTPPRSPGDEEAGGGIDLGGNAPTTERPVVLPSPADDGRGIGSLNVKVPQRAADSEPAVDGAVVIYPFKTLDFRRDFERLKKQYAGKANIHLNDHPNAGSPGVPSILVRAPAEIQAEIRGAINTLAINILDGGPPQKRWDLLQSPSNVPGNPGVVNRNLGYHDLLESSRQRTDFALKLLQEAQSDEEKLAAKDALRKVLAVIFAEDMEARRMQSQEIESRLAKLRQQFQDREKVRDQIIDLQMQVLEKDAAGLGFPGVRPGSPTPNDAPRPPVPFGQPNLPAAVPTPNDAPRSPNPFGQPNQSGGAALTPGDDHVEGSGLPSGNVPTIELRAPLKQPTGPDGPVVESNAVSAPARTALPVPASHGSVVAEYNQLRSQYLKAKAQKQRADSAFNTLLEEARKQKPNSPIDDLKKQHPTAWRVVEQATPAWEEAQRLYETKLELLEIDRKAAMVARDAVSDKLRDLTELYKRNEATRFQVDEQHTLILRADLEVERVQKILELFKSIQNATPDAGGGSGTSSEAGSGTSSGIGSETKHKDPDSIQVIALSRNRAEAVAQILAKVLSAAERPVVAVDERMNSLILRGSPEAIQKAIALVEALDREVDPKTDTKGPAPQ